MIYNYEYSFDNMIHLQKMKEFSFIFFQFNDIIQYIVANICIPPATKFSERQKLAEK